jgi:hypothetical protein
MGKGGRGGKGRGEGRWFKKFSPRPMSMLYSKLENYKQAVWHFLEYVCARIARESKGEGGSVWYSLEYVWHVEHDVARVARTGREGRIGGEGEINLFILN